MTASKGDAQCKLKIWLQERKSGAGFEEKHEAVPECKYKPGSEVVTCPGYLAAMSTLRAKTHDRR
jgi:hypothetical protein